MWLPVLAVAAKVSLPVVVVAENKSNEPAPPAPVALPKSMSLPMMVGAVKVVTEAAVNVPVGLTPVDITNDALPPASGIV